MKYCSIIPFIIVLNSCVNDTNGGTDFYSKVIVSVRSPDGKKILTLQEYGIDTTECVTQVIVDFGKTGSGVYATNGKNLDIKIYWQDNNTIVINTKKEYRADQKWPQVQSFGDIVKVIYIEK